MKHQPAYQPPQCASCPSKDQSLFRFCSCLELEKMYDGKSCTTYKRGQTVFQEGGHPLGLFCIYQGSVKLVKQASGGKEQIVRVATEGELLGYRSLLTKKRYSSTAVVVEESKLCIIPKADFDHLVHSNQQFHQALVELLCETAEDLENKMTNIAYKPVRGRIAEALVLLSQVYDDTIDLSREDLASFVGTVKETTIRTLSEFREESLIEIDNRRIRVKNLEGLVKISHLYD
jgi:CRP-like cAMP-binding protein